MKSSIFALAIAFASPAWAQGQPASHSDHRCCQDEEGDCCEEEGSDCCRSMTDDGQHGGMNHDGHAMGHGDHSMDHDQQGAQPQPE